MIINSNELLINMKRTPDEDSQEFSLFWKNERDKCKYGIYIDQTFISGFLYYHLNFFKCQLDVLDNGRIVRKLANPYLRDNEWLIDSYIREAEKAKKGLCILGSRRLAKSVYESSYISHRATFFKGTQNVIAGLNDPDIKVITDLVDEALINLPIAFKQGRVEDNWKRQVTLGEKTPSGERFPWSSIPIRNLDGGKNTEALAGLSPFSMVIDEIGKGDWLKAFSAAIPGFATPYGWRCSPLAFGTSGDMEKAQDAKKVFDSPEAYNFLAVEVPDEPSKKTSVFISGHYAHDFPKDDMPLSAYLKTSNTPNLSKINIKVTNFERAESMINEERDQARKSDDSSALLKLTMYHPKNRSELFLTDSNNNFPVEAAKALKEKLLQNYDPVCVDFYRELDGKPNWKYSDLKPIMNYPVKPSDDKLAPCVMYEPPIKTLPYGTYIIGIDPFEEDSSSDKINSLGSFYVFKRMHSPFEPYQDSIVLSYAGRPKTVSEFNELVLMVTEYYGAIALPENENKTLIQHFFAKQKAHLLADTLQLAKVISPTSRTERTKGLAATTPNQRYGMSRAYQYTKEEIEATDEFGNMCSSLGINRIPDPMLLEEMIQYRGKTSASRGVHDGNYDRCFPKGFLVNTKSGYKDVSDIKIGDNVLTHNGSYKEVFETFKSGFNGELIKIKPLGSDDFIKSTPNHPYLIGRYSKKPMGIYWNKRKENLDIINWVEAKDIKKGDFLFIPIKKERTKRELEDDVLYLIGWYLSDGNISNKGRLRITFQGDQLDLALRCQEILNKYDNFPSSFINIKHHISNKNFVVERKKVKPTIKKVKGKFAFNLECTSLWFNDIINKYVTVLDGGEKILKQNLISQENLLPLILGFFEGDGSQNTSKRKDNSIRSSLSVSGTYLNLIYQIREVILNEGIWCTISPTKSKNKNRNLQLRIDIQDWEGINKIVENSLKFKKVDLIRTQQ